jgi:8-oxo-dGTP pyrophosphatase MutT (NUDIX family)
MLYPCYFHKPVVNVTGLACRDFVMFVFLLQGGWENDETVEEAAAREAIEEAGVRGDIVVRCLYKAGVFFSKLLFILPIFI